MSNKTFIIPPPIPASDLVFPKRYNFTPDPEDAPIATSMLGTPVYSNLIFLADGSGVGNPTTLDPDAGKTDLRIDTVLITVNMAKNIVKTPIQGRDGTVKEYISDGDYIINVVGAIVSPYSLVYPREEVDLLIRYCQAKQSLAVSSFFLDLFGITNAVIDDYKFSEKLGTRNEQPFELSMSSDQPIEFKLNPNRGL